MNIGPKTILIVDDDLTSLELIDFVLSKHYRTLLATKGEEALRLTDNERPDLIILDLLMPGVSGTDLCKQFKSNPATREIPVLFLSAMVAEKEIEAGFRAGASGYIFKPFDSVQVVKKIEEILKVSSKG